MTLPQSRFARSAAGLALASTLVAASAPAMALAQGAEVNVLPAASPQPGAAPAAGGAGSAAGSYTGLSNVFPVTVRAGGGAAITYALKRGETRSVTVNGQPAIISLIPIGAPAEGVPADMVKVVMSADDSGIREAVRQGRLKGSAVVPAGSPSRPVRGGFPLSVLTREAKLLQGRWFGFGAAPRQRDAADRILQVQA